MDRGHSSDIDIVLRSLKAPPSELKCISGLWWGMVVCFSENVFRCIVQGEGL